MIDIIDDYYYGSKTNMDGYDKGCAKKAGVGEILPLIMDNELTPRQSLCLKYKYIYGKSQAEIAQLLNISQPTVSRHINTAKDIVNSSLTYCLFAMDKSIDEYERLQNMA